MKKILFLLALLTATSDASLPPQKCTGENFLTCLAGEKIQANPVTLSGTNVTGVLPNAKTTATSANTASAIVARDGSGDFSCHTVTATGNLAATGTVTGSNLSGTNTGDITIGTFGSSPDAKAATLSSQVLTLQPADATHPGAITSGAQTLAGAKTFNDPIGLGVAPGSATALKVKSAVDALDAGIQLEGPGSSGNRFWDMYLNPTGDLFFYNPGAGTTGLTQKQVGFNGFGPQSPRWLFDVNGSNSSTNPGSLTSGDQATLAIRNINSTAGNYTTLVFEGSASPAPTSFISGINDNHTDGAGTGHIEIWTNNAGTFGKRASIGSGGITATLIGNSSTATALASNPVDCGANTYATTIAANGDLTCASITNASTTAVSTNTASTIVLRDGSGNFSAGTISAALTGTASGNTTYTANQYGVVLSGSANAMSVLAPDSSTAKALVSGGASANPSWATLGIGGGGTGQTTKAAAFDALSPMSASGDIIYGGTSGTGTRLAKGSDTQVLTLAGGLPTWAAPGFANPMTTQGDIIYGGSSGAATRLAQGTANQLLGFRGSNTSPSYRSINETTSKNYIRANPDAEVDTTGWATYSDGASNVPVDCTGGTATSLTFSRSTSSPLHDVGSFSMVQANSTSIQGKGVSYAFTIDSADQAKPLEIRYDYNASSTFVASDGRTAPLNDATVTTNAGNSDVETFVYDVTNAVLIPVSPQVITANGSNNFTFKGTFQTASNSTSYRVCQHVATASANATGWTFKYDNFFVGPQIVNYGFAGDDWGTNYVITTTNFGTATNAAYKTRRNGDSLEVQFALQSGASPSGTSYFGLPAGLTIDTTKLPSTSSGTIVGMGSEVYNSTARALYTNEGIAFFYDGSTNNQIYVAYNTGSNVYTKATSTGSRYMSGFWKVPITGWSSNTTMSNDSDTRLVYAIISGDPASATSGNPIIVPTVGVDSHGGYNATTGRYTVPVSGIYKMYGALQSASSATTLTIYKNASSSALAGNLDSNGEATFAGAVNAVAGDIIDLRPGGTVDATNMTMNIERMSGPATIAASDSVGFRYYASGTSLSGSLATISWTTKDWDSHGGMSSGTYTVPVAGKYQCNSSLALSGTFLLNNQIDMQLQKNGTAAGESLEYDGGAVTQSIVQLSDIVNVVAGDTLRIQVSSQGTSPAIVSSNTRNYFSCHRVGG